VARKPTQSPTEAELEILKVLWELGPCTLGEVWKAILDNRQVARKAGGSGVSLVG